MGSCEQTIYFKRTDITGKGRVLNDSTMLDPTLTKPKEQQANRVSCPTAEEYNFNLSLIIKQ